MVGLSQKAANLFPVNANCAFPLITLEIIKPALNGCDCNIHGKWLSKKDVVFMNSVLTHLPCRCLLMSIDLTHNNLV